MLQKLADRQFEAQKKEEGMTETEKEEQAVHKRRAEGTPCTQEHFDKWKAVFDAEMEEKKLQEQQAKDAGPTSKKNKEKKVEDKSGRISGFLQFSGKMGAMNMEDIEKAVEEAEEAPMDPDEIDNGEDELFDFDDDEDLDDLDFEDDDEEEEEDLDI